MMINEHQDASNNYARGSYTLGKKMVNPIDNCIRRIAEQLDHLRGFFMFSSSGGGTGSGLTPIINLILLKNYPKATRNNFSVVPGKNFTAAVVEPYNMFLENFAITETSDLNILYQNEGIYDICSKKLFINCPTFSDINRLLAMAFSCISCPLRYSSMLRSAMDDMITNLIPFPRIHYPIVRIAPINHISKVSYEMINTYDITKELFSKEMQSVKIDTNKGLFISIVLNYQGVVQQSAIYRYIDEVRKFHGNRFVEWSPTGFKVGICKQIPSVCPMIDIAPSDQFATMLMNTTAISQFFKSQARKFDLLFTKRSFVHWYLGEGMEELEFTESRDEIEMLNGDLKEISLSEIQLASFSRD